MRGIIMDVESIVGTLRGDKTRTSRVMVNPPVYWQAGKVGSKTVPLYTQPPYNEIKGMTLNELISFCPYGKSGDVLYVKEKSIPVANGYSYETYASGEMAHDGSVKVAWSNPRHMPRWLSRIRIQIKSIAIQHIQDISIADIKREGVTEKSRTLYGLGYTGAARLNLVKKDYADEHGYQYWDGLTGVFAMRWDDLNRKRGYGWLKNPWVYAIDYKLVEVKDGKEIVRPEAKSKRKKGGNS